MSPLAELYDIESGRIPFSWRQCKTVQKLYWHEPNIARMIPDYPELVVDFFCLLFYASVELGPPTNGQTQTKGDWEQGGERNIWIDNGESNRRRGKAVYQERNNSYRSPNINDQQIEKKAIKTSDTNDREAWRMIMTWKTWT